MHHQIPPNSSSFTPPFALAYGGGAGCPEELHFMHETMQLAVEPPPLPESESSYGFARLPPGVNGGCW